MVWTEVRSEVPQGSILEPLVFTIFIDGIDEEVLCEISKFADDPKIASRVNTLVGVIICKEHISHSNRYNNIIIISDAVIIISCCSNNKLLRLGEEM